MQKVTRLQEFALASLFGLQLRVAWHLVPEAGHSGISLNSAGSTAPDEPYEGRVPGCRLVY
jgi:hypothetical protein